MWQAVVTLSVVTAVINATQKCLPKLVGDVKHGADIEVEIMLYEQQHIYISCEKQSCPALPNALVCFISLQILLVYLLIISLF